MLGQSSRTSASSPDARIETLDESAAARVRLSFWSRFDSGTLAATVATYPHRSVWIPKTSEYAVARPWRHRDEIAELAELSAMRHPEALVEAAAERAGKLGAFLLLMVEVEESRRPSFYSRIGMDLLEEVVTYELRTLPPESARPSRLTFRRADVEDPHDLSELLAIDGASFPWVWRNSPAEFREYGDAPGVEIFLGRRDGRPAAYLGLTAHLGFGHIDRVAVLPDQQGVGLGTEAVRFGIDRLASAGAKKIGLSTQRVNHRSQHVYERLGFRRAITNDYRLYGKILACPDGVANMFAT
jgi:ribosomal protein S18 acetylase RimI-like enzyme